MFNLERDYEYFSSIWNEKGEKQMLPSTAWDGRASDWEKELGKKENFHSSMDKRIISVADYLRSNGMLVDGSEVLDIGCGPGRFVTEFAKTAGHVTGIDFSEKMINLGRKHAEECGAKNVTFLTEDFTQTDVKALGWERKFDLVFASITPALGTMECLEKAMEICKGYCFHSFNIRWRDDLREKIKKDLFKIENVTEKACFGKCFYSLFNLLWIKGYFPRTDYYINDKEEIVRADRDLATYYARTFSEDLIVSEELVEKIQVYLEGIADEDGYICRKFERWQGWIFWDVRNCIPRLK